MKKRALLAAVLAILLCLAGCNSGKGSDTPQDTSVELNLISGIMVSGEKAYKTDYSYNTNGSLAQKGYVDNSGRGVANLKYNEAGQLIECSTLRNIDHGAFPHPYAAKRNYSYDASGRLSTIICHDLYENNTETLCTYMFKYNDAGRVEKVLIYNEEDALSGRINFTYDSAGRVTERSSDGSTTKYTYDAEGKLTQIYTKEGSTERTFIATYDDAGLLTRMATADGTYAANYTYSAIKFQPEAVEKAKSSQADLMFNIYGIY